jgi:hypothetical protein
MAPTDPLASWWVHTVTVARFAGDGPEGDSWATPEAGVACFVSEKRALVRAPNGEQVVAETTVYFPRSTADIPPGSLVTIGAPFTARTTTVIATSRHDGGGLPTPDHLEVALA